MSFGENSLSLSFKIGVLLCFPQDLFSCKFKWIVSFCNRLRFDFVVKAELSLLDIVDSFQMGLRAYFRSFSFYQAAKLVALVHIRNKLVRFNLSLCTLLAFDYGIEKLWRLVRKCVIEHCYVAAVVAGGWHRIDLISQTSKIMWRSKNYRIRRFLHAPLPVYKLHLATMMLNCLWSMDISWLFHQSFFHSETRQSFVHGLMENVVTFEPRILIFHMAGSNCWLVACRSYGISCDYRFLINKYLHIWWHYKWFHCVSFGSGSRREWKLGHFLAIKRLIDILKVKLVLRLRVRSEIAMVLRIDSTPVLAGKESLKISFVQRRLIINCCGGLPTFA